MILFCANVDTEILALRSTIEDLPRELQYVAWATSTRCRTRAGWRRWPDGPGP